MTRHTSCWLGDEGTCLLWCCRKPYHGINFVIAHDGFTLYDLVAYNDKHNDANGESNRDGSNDNFSWNCGAEVAVFTLLIIHPALVNPKRLSTARQNLLGPLCEPSEGMYSRSS